VSDNALLQCRSKKVSLFASHGHYITPKASQHNPSRSERVDRYFQRNKFFTFFIFFTEKYSATRRSLSRRPPASCDSGLTTECRRQRSKCPNTSVYLATITCPMIGRTTTRLTTKKTQTHTRQQRTTSKRPARRVRSRPSCPTSSYNGKRPREDESTEP